MSRKKKEEKSTEKTINDLIIDEAVKQFKEGKIKSSLDVEDYLDSLLQPLMQRLLDTELENHLEYSKYTHKKGKETNNVRNGHCEPKTVKTKYGNIQVEPPRDRNATFRPIIIEKGQTKLTGFEEKCIALYAKGISLRDIEKTLKELYGVKINKDDITSSKKAVYVIIGVDVQGFKEIRGLWIDGSESGSFWNNVFEDLKERGVQDILYMSSDGIAGFKGSLERVFPKTQTQRCVVHLVRNIYSLCPRKEAKQIIADYKKIYTSSTLEEAEFQLDIFKQRYEEKHSRIVKKAMEFMQYLEPLFDLPQEIRKCIYTSNAIESVNSALRKVTRGKGAFPSESSVYKVMFLRIKELSEKWSKPIQNWTTIQQQIINIFGERYTQYLNI